MTRVTDLVTDYLAVWVTLAVAAGLALPSIAAAQPLILPVLAVMIGAMALTLDLGEFRAVPPAILLGVLAAQALMAPIAYGIAVLLGLGPAATLGFVVLGAVTPELTTPVMVHLAEGDAALATSVLVLAGLLSLVTVPGWAVLLAGDAIAFDPVSVLKPLVVAVVAPTVAGVAIRHRWTPAVRRGDDVYPAVSAAMVVVVIAIVAAANADVVLGGGPLIAVAAGAVLLNAVGYGVGAAVGLPLGRGRQRAAVLSVGMRDFAVAAGVVLAAGLPALAALPAVVFGLVEMVSAAGLARGMARRVDPR